MRPFVTDPNPARIAFDGALAAYDEASKREQEAQAEFNAAVKKTFAASIKADGSHLAPLAERVQRLAAERVRLNEALIEAHEAWLRSVGR